MASLITIGEYIALRQPIIADILGANNNNKSQASLIKRYSDSQMTFAHLRRLMEQVPAPGWLAKAGGLDD